VRDLLGHASILTTERYDNQRLEALQAAVERLEGGKTFDPQRHAEATAEVSSFFQVSRQSHSATRQKATDENPRNH
jgi:hypothetical protein